MTEQDGSFRRLVETVREQRTVPSGLPGRPPKNRLPTTGYFAKHLHNRFKAIAQKRTKEAGHLVSASDIYNEASALLIEDMHHLLGDELRLPPGVVTFSAMLALREIVDRPIRTPLRDLNFEGVEQQRTSLYFDPVIWDALIEMSLRFGLRLRRLIHAHRMVELAAAWYLADMEKEPDSES